MMGQSKLLLALLFLGWDGVKSKLDKRILVYVLCYDDISCAAGHSFFDQVPWARMLLLPNSIFFETHAFTEIFPDRIKEDKWGLYDYVGTVSWKAPLKFMEAFKFGPFVIPDVLKRSPPEADVIALVAQKGDTDSILRKATLAHPRFREIWEGLLGAFGTYTPEQISTEGMVPFYCNYWLARPQHVVKFIAFMQKARHLMLTLKSIQEPLWSDAGYESNAKVAQKVFGLDYYTHHPFVLERLTPFFFNVEKLNITIYKKFRVVWSLNASAVKEPPLHIDNRREMEKIKILGRKRKKAGPESTNLKEAQSKPRLSPYDERYHRYRSIAFQETVINRLR